MQFHEILRDCEPVQDDFLGLDQGWNTPQIFQGGGGEGVKVEGVSTNVEGVFEGGKSL